MKVLGNCDSCQAALSVPGIADLVMPLSTEPTLGTWKIVLTRSDDSDEIAHFDVEEYGKSRDDESEEAARFEVEEYGKSCGVEKYSTVRAVVSRNMVSAS